MPLRLIKEEWTPRSVTSIFSPPSSDQLKNARADTERCGLGWRFSFSKAGDDQPGKRHLYIRPYCDISMYRRATVTAIATFQPSTTYDNPSLEAVTLGGFTLHAFDPLSLKTVKSRRLPGTWTRAQLCGQEFISFTVTFDAQPPVENLLTLLRRMTLADPLAQEVTPVTTDGSDRPAVRVALARSLNTGEAFDIKFIAFSWRKDERSLGGPRPVYANSTVLMAISSDLDFQSSKRDDPLFSELGSQPDPRQPDVLEGYDYESDSDIDDNEEELEDSEPSEPVPEAAAEEGRVVDIESNVQPMCIPTLSSDVIQEATIEEKVHPAGESIISTPPISDFEDVGSEVHVPQDRVEGEDFPATSNRASSSATRTVLVKGAAYKTWRALIYYCYTGQIVFSPLKSCNAEHTPALAYEGATPCSPKSMYRLADSLGIDGLKEIALAAIKNDLSQKNILDEAFSKFTSRYPAIQDMEVKLLVEHRSAPEVVTAFPTKIQKIFRGEIPHAETVHSDFMQRLLQN